MAERLRLRRLNAALTGFTLIELLVVIAIVAVLAAMLLPALARAKQSSRTTQCLGQMRQIALAVRLYADENEDLFPRSEHTAVACGQLPWGRAITPQLGQNPALWTNLFRGLYHCPCDLRAAPWSYGQNVYFELNPDNDDYTGSPQTWRRMALVPCPVNTILQAETSGGADHVMAEFWTCPQDATGVDALRHKGRSNYNFVDGHSEARVFITTYAPTNNVDLWNPCLAR